MWYLTDARSFECYNYLSYLLRIHLFDMFMRKRNGRELDYPVDEAVYAVRMFGTEQDITERKAPISC